MLTAGTNYGMITLFSGKTKVVLAGRTLSVNVSLLVAFFALLKIEELFRFIRKSNKLLVFLLPFVNIS